MIESLQWVDARAAIQSVIDGTTHDGHTVSARYEQTADEYGQPVVDGVEVIVYDGIGGTIEWVDRLDELTLECYAPRGETAKRVLDSVVSSLAGANVSTPEGFLDTIRVRTAPTDVPYQSPVLSKAIANIQVISRPI